MTDFAGHLLAIAGDTQNVQVLSQLLSLYTGGIVPSSTFTSALQSLGQGFNVVGAVFGVAGVVETIVSNLLAFGAYIVQQGDYPTVTLVTSASSSTPTPLPAPRYVYVSTNNGMSYAIDVATGKTLWSMSGDVVATNGTTVYINNNPQLIAVDANTGTMRWHQSVPTDVNISPVYASDLNGLYLTFTTPNNQNSTVNALSVQTGSLRWQYQVTGLAPGPEGNNVLAAADGKVFVVSGSNAPPYNGSLDILDASTGNPLHSVQLGGLGENVAVASSHIFVNVTDTQGASAGYVFDEATENPLWDTRAACGPNSNNGVPDGSVLAGGGDVFITCYSNDSNGVIQRVLRADPNTGNSLGAMQDAGYQFPAGSSVDGGIIPEGVERNRLIVEDANAGNIYTTRSLETTNGTTVWQIDQQYMANGDSDVFVVSSANALSALDAMSGNPVWTSAFPGDGSTITSVVIGG